MQNNRKRIKPKGRRGHHCCEVRIVYVPYVVTTTPYVPSYPSWWYQPTYPTYPNWTITSTSSNATIPNTTLWNG